MIGIISGSETRKLPEEHKLFQELYHLVFVLNQPATLQELFDRSLAGIMKVLEVDRASLLTFDEQDVMRFRAWLNLSPTYRRAVDGHSPWTADEKNPRPVLIADIYEDPGLTELLPVFQQEGIRALGFIPLIKEGWLIGKFMLYYDTPHAFSDEEVQLAEIVAQHIVHAIDRSQSQQALLQYGEKQKILGELGQYALNHYYRLPQLMSQIINRTVETLAVDLCELLALQPDGKSLRLVAGYGWDEGLVGKKTIEAGLSSQAGYTMQHHQPIIVNDLSRETRFEPPELLLSHNVVSGMTVIIEGGERPYGVLGVHTTSPRRFNQDEVHFLQVIANILAAAIQQRRAMAALQAANEDLENRVATRTALLREEIILREMVEEALRQESDYIQLLHRINEIANEPYSLEEAFQLILDQICDFSGWPLGHVFIQASEIFEDGRKNELVSSDIWHCKTAEQFSIIREVTSKTSVKKGAGWVGKVFESGEPVWLTLDSEKEVEERNKALQGSGITGVLAFPVLVADEVVAIMELFTADMREPEEDLLGVMAQIGTQLGRIVERKRAGMIAKKNEKDLRDLTGSLIRQQEEERRLIAHELHDEIGQSLSVLKLELDVLAADIKDIQHQKALNNASRMARYSLGRVQQLSYDLRPPELDTIGLNAALFELCQVFANKADYSVKYNGTRQLPKDVPDTINLSLYRTLQEGLGNALKYSNASRVVVELAYENNELALTIEDNGEWPERLETAELKKQSLRVLELAERFRRLGGFVTFTSNETAGKTLKVVVPWEE